jgi:hypothetical protein
MTVFDPANQGAADVSFHVGADVTQVEHTTIRFRCSTFDGNQARHPSWQRGSDMTGDDHGGANRHQRHAIQPERLQRGGEVLDERVERQSGDAALGKSRPSKIAVS